MLESGPKELKMTITSSDKGFPPVHLAWLVWGCGAALYVLGFFQLLNILVVCLRSLNPHRLDGIFDLKLV